MLLLWLTLVGGALGAVGVWLAAQPITLGACLAAAAYGVCAGFAVAVPIWILAAIAARSERLSQAWQRLSLRLSAQADEREAIVRLHAWAITILALCLALSASSLRASQLMSAIQDDGLAADLRLLSGFLLMVAAMALALPLSRLAAVSLRAIDRRRRLSWMVDRETALFVVLPAVGFLLWLLRRHHDVLGGLLPLCATLILVLLALPAALPPRRLKGRRVRGMLQAIGGVSALVVVVVGFRAHGRDQAAARAADSTAWARLIQPILLKLGDPDRDGASAWLGGGDCAPFDPTIFPHAVDLPKNGIDENCDGEDATGVVGTDRPEPLYSGAAQRSTVKNVVLVIIDAVRMDHTSLVPGYRHRSTPNLENLAEASFLYTNALSQSSATLFSIPSLLMGRNPDQVRWTFDKRHAPTIDQKVLPELLRPFGFHSAIILNTYIINNYSGVTRGFDAVLDPWKGKKPDTLRRGASGAAITLGIEYIEGRLRETPSKPFFLTLYFDDPHAPYIAHKAFPYGKDPKSLHIGEVAHSDAQLGFFIDYLKNRGTLWDDTMLIVTSDHGEQFGEHGGRYHATSCHIESVHVPLLVRIPGVADSAKRIDSPVALVDLAPTILESLGHTDYRDLDGQSLLLPALSQQPPTPRTIRCATASQRAGVKPFYRRAFRNERFTLMEDDGKFSLFDAADKGERNELEGHEAERKALVEYARGTTTGNLADHTKF